MLRHQPSTCTPVSGPNRSTLRSASVPDRSSTGVGGVRAEQHDQRRSDGPLAAQPLVHLVGQRLEQRATPRERDRTRTCRCRLRSGTASSSQPAGRRLGDQRREHHVDRARRVLPDQRPRGRGRASRTASLPTEASTPTLRPGVGGQRHGGGPLRRRRCTGRARPAATRRSPAGRLPSSSSSRGDRLPSNSRGCGVGRRTRVQPLLHRASTRPGSRRPGCARSRCRAGARTRG